MKHIQTFEDFLNEAKNGKWKAAYNGKGYYGVTNGGPIEGEMSKEDAEAEAEKRNQVNEKVNLNSKFLSSVEYQQAKKLKNFNPDEWKWDSDKGLYAKITESSMLESDDLDVVEWDQFVKPEHIILTLSNGNTLRIDKKRVKGGTAAYYKIIDMLEAMPKNPKARESVKELVKQMLGNLK